MNEIRVEHVGAMGAVTAAQAGVMHRLGLLQSTCPTGLFVHTAARILAQNVFNCERQLLLRLDTSIHFQENPKKADTVSGWKQATL